MKKTHKNNKNAAAAAIALLLALCMLAGCFGGASQPPETKPAQDSEPAPPQDTETAAPQENGTEADPLAEAAAARVAGMTLEERVAQMFIVMPEALVEIKGPVTVARDTTRNAFNDFPVGGILYMGRNLVSNEQTAALTQGMQQISRARVGLPAFLCVDEEGGEVARISGSGKFGISGFEEMRYVTTAYRAEEIGDTIGGYLSALGFNVDFAPCADVLSNENNQVVRRRSFGADPETVTALSAAYAAGLQRHGVLAAYKHFPGHGATAEDSHKGFAVSYRTREELLRSDLVPFADAAEKEIPFVMVGHISTPNATSDGLPASLSPAMITGLLREELGYNGLVITDELSMGAISQYYTPGEAAVLAVKAGNDILLLGSALRESYTAVLDAVRSGEISEERINESVGRIVKTKLALEG